MPPPNVNDASDVVLGVHPVGHALDVEFRELLALMLLRVNPSETLGLLTTSVHAMLGATTFERLQATVEGPEARVLVSLDRMTKQDAIISLSDAAAWLLVIHGYVRCAFITLAHYTELFVYLQWCRRYWEWADQHGWQFMLHDLPRWVRTPQWPGAQYRTTRCHVLTTKARIHHAETRCVETLGRVHNALQPVLSIIRVHERFEDLTVPTEEDFRASAMHAVAGVSAAIGHIECGVPLGEKLRAKDCLVRLSHVVASAKAQFEAEKASAVLLHPPRCRLWIRALRYGAFAAAAVLVARQLKWADVNRLRLRAQDTVRSFITSYLTEPIVGIFTTLTLPPSERRGALREKEVQQDVEGLRRMIKQYEQDKGLGSVHRAHPDDIGDVNADYETAIRAPLRSALMGNLTRIMLIQLQKQKVDLNGVLVMMDNVLEQHELNFHMIALLPFVITFSALFAVLALRRRAHQIPVHNRIFQCLRKVDAIVNMAERDDGPTERPSGHGSTTTMLHNAQQGYLLLHVHEMRCSAAYLPAEQCQMLKEDLDELENSQADRARRLHTIGRMFRTYPFLDQSRVATT